MRGASGMHVPRARLGCERRGGWHWPWWRGQGEGAPGSANLEQELLWEVSVKQDGCAAQSRHDWQSGAPTQGRASCPDPARVRRMLAPLNLLGFCASLFVVKATGCCSCRQGCHGTLFHARTADDIAHGADDVAHDLTAAEVHMIATKAITVHAGGKGEKIKRMMETAMKRWRQR